MLNTLRVTGAWIIVTFYCLHQISKFFHKTSPVRCALRAHLIKSVHINFYFQAAKSRKLRVLIPVYKKSQIVYTLEKSLPSSWWHGIFFEFARLKLVLLKGHIRREMFSEKILKFDAGNKKLQWFMPPSLSKCWARCNIFMSRQTIEQNPNQIFTRN